MTAIRITSWLLLGLLLAATLIPAGVAAAPEAGKSKLTIHTSFTGPLSMPFIRDAQPRVVKLLGGASPGSPWDQAAAIKAASPGTLIVGRIYFADEPATGDPAARAREWWDRCKGVILAYPQVDYWEGYNEPSVDSVAKMQYLATFDAERVRILAANGRKAAIGSFSVGTPQIVTSSGARDGSYWRAYYPAIDAAQANSGVLALHEYSAPSMRDMFETASGEGWTTGRYRKVYSWFLKPDGREIPLIITECGIDGGVIGQGQKGWKSYTGAEGYLDQLKWYDSLLLQDSYVMGATIFSLEIPNWQDFDIAPLMPQLTAYVKTGGTTPPPVTTNNAQFITQQVPDTMTAGQLYTVSVTMKNTGTSTWTAANNYRLGSQNPQDNKIWLRTSHRVNLGGSDAIAPGQQKTFTFTVTAPSTTGTYNFQWQMLQESVAWFGASSSNRQVKVVAPVANNAQYVSQDVQPVMAADQRYTVSVVMKNTGTATWTPGSSYRLGSQNPQDNKIWLRTSNRVYLNDGESIAPGREKAFTFLVTAPSTAGTYHFQWQMLREMVAWFGQKSTDVSIQVLPKTAVVTNAGFEQGTTGWSGFRAAATAVSTPVRSGSRALSLTASGPAYTVKNGVTCYGGFNTAPFVQVAGNTKYTASVWLRGSTSPGEAMIYVQQFSGTSYAEKIKSSSDGFAYDVLAKKSVRSGDGWVQLSVPFTTTAGTRYVSISLNGNTAGVPLTFDDVSLVAG
ncbi:MAG: carbohydrate binding domain-containing protein [Methanomicrobiales archaeon]|nr:carbohydrate binding domain-containing protein [Methanomicrobiales archaeon]